MTRYIPHTPGEISQMLATIGVKSVDDLFADIPAAVKQTDPINLPAGLSEPEVVRHMHDLAGMNDTTADLICFLGAGAYDHYIPTAVHHLVSRGEFLTSYTPYQPEVSQGTLQAIYEFQSLMCALTGMDQANASMYEGATALAEGALIAVSQTQRHKLLISRAVHPEYREVLATLVQHLGIKCVTIGVEDGVTDGAALAAALDQTVAGVVVQYPNFFGCIEDLELICAKCREVGALSVVASYPVALGLLKPPGAFGADVVAGEGQCLGSPLAFGGPYLGFLAARECYIRKMPGRIAGRTLDCRGQNGFVLTLQTREQHIRREKATSNICSNEALLALTATVHLATLGAAGLRAVSQQCLQKAHHLKTLLAEVPGVSIPFTASFFNEFVVKIPGAKKVIKKLADQGVLGGLPLEDRYPELKDCVLVAVTEKRTAEEMHLFAELLKGLLA